MPHGGIIVNNNDNQARRGHREVANLGVASNLPRLRSGRVRP